MRGGAYPIPWSEAAQPRRLLGLPSYGPFSLRQLPSNYCVPKQSLMRINWTLLDITLYALWTQFTPVHHRGTQETASHPLCKNWSPKSGRQLQAYHHVQKCPQSSNCNGSSPTQRGHKRTLECSSDPGTVLAQAGEWLRHPSTPGTSYTELSKRSMIHRWTHTVREGQYQNWRKGAAGRQSVRQRESNGWDCESWQRAWMQYQKKRRLSQLVGQH